MTKSRFAISALILTTLFIVSKSVLLFAQDDEVVNIYSARKEALILPLLKEFKEETGIDFQLVTGKADALLKRIQTEGANTPVDVFITVDAGRLQRAKEVGILQPVSNSSIKKKLPAHLRDKDDYWISLSKRARVIFYAKDRVNPRELSTYESLADKKWKNRICVRSSSNIYNQSLVASMIEHLGEKETEKWARGLVVNFARDPSGGDTDQLRAVAAGECDIAVANTYYYGRLINSDKPENNAVAKELGLFWPNQQDRGAHFNVSGVGVIKNAKHRQAAEKLLEFLYSSDSQHWYATVNNEYPVVPGTEISDTLRDFGVFKADDINLTILGENNSAALKLMDRAGWK